MTASNRLLRCAGLRDQLEAETTGHRAMASSYEALREAAAATLQRLGLAQSSNPARLADELQPVFERVVALSRSALVRGVHQSFSLMRAHYPGVKLTRMAQGFPEYSAAELDSFEEEALALAEFFAGTVVPGPNAGGRPRHRRRLDLLEPC